MSQTFTVYIEYDAESELYVGTVPGLSGAHSHGATLDELQANMQEVLELVLEEHASRGEAVESGPFVGIQQITVTV